MRAAMYPPGITHLETTDVVDALSVAGHSDWPDTSAFVAGVFGIIRARTTALASAVLVAGFRWWAALGLLAIWFVAGRTLRRGQAEAYADTHGVLRRSSYVREIAFGRLSAKEVRVFGLADWVIERFSRGWYDVMRTVWRRRRVARLQGVGVLFLVLGGHAAFFIYLVDAAQRGDVTLARLAVVVPAVMALSSLGTTDEHTISVALGAVALPAIEQVEAALVTGSRFAVPGASPVEDRPQHEIRFEAVGFSYPGRSTLVYDNLDLTVPVGKSIAIVGANGAGKTTLVKLLARLYEPTAGRITVDGVALTDLDPREWQRRVAAIFQDFVQYEMSARDNVGFGAVEHHGDVERLNRAAARVGADELITSLEHGWDTILSRRYKDGAEISGGQWQRVALARALMAVDGGARVLVLDEPTANLDVRAEAELFDRFLDVTRGSTTILISHRFSTVRRADRIVVLDNGRVVEDGTHDELVSLGGRYARLFRLQADRYEARVVSSDV